MVVSAIGYILATRFHIPAPLIELSSSLNATVGITSVLWYFVTLRQRRETSWLHSILLICIC